MPARKKTRAKKSTNRAKGAYLRVIPVPAQRGGTERSSAGQSAPTTIAAFAAAAGEFKAKPPPRGMRYEIFGSLDPTTVREKIVHKQIGMNLVVQVLHDAIGLDAKGIGAIIDVTPRTIAKRAADAKTLETSSQGDRAWRLARIYDFAIDMIGDPNKAARWLRSPNRFLKGQVPIEMLETEVGTQAVEQSLAAIGYGQVG